MVGHVKQPEDQLASPDPTHGGNQAASGDERGVVRRRVLKAAIIAFNGRHSTLPCFVRDLSDAGARIRIDGSINAPDTFELLIELDGLEAECEVAWRQGDEIGIRFTTPPKYSEPKRKQVIAPMLKNERPSIRRKVKSTG